VKHQNDNNQRCRVSINVT